MKSFSSTDQHYMQRALHLAKKGLYTTHPNPRVGCVLVKNNQIIGEGFHVQAGKPHAEINALAIAGDKAKGATAYVTLEPCSHFGKTPPCSQALIIAGVKQVFVAMKDPNPLVAGRGLQQLEQAGIKTHCGLLAQQARHLNLGFIKRMEKGLPWVRVKLAMSLDGRTAMASGESQWITGKEARHDVQFLRAKADAILTGIGTVLDDNPSLNVRLTPETLNSPLKTIRQPTRIIVDSNLKISPQAKMFTLAGKTWIYTRSKDQQKYADLKAAGGKVILSEANQNNQLNLKTVLHDLSQREINEVHVEAGATLCGALLQENLVDELIIYMAPNLMGSEGRGLVNLPNLAFMKDRINLTINNIIPIGKDWLISATPTIK